MMTPRRRRTMRRAAAWATRNVPLRLTLRSHVASESSRNGTIGSTAALVTATSIRPQARWIASKPSRIGHGDPRALARERERDRLADAASGARHERDLVLEPHTDGPLVGRSQLVPTAGHSQSVPSSRTPLQRWPENGAAWLRPSNPRSE